MKPAEGTTAAVEGAVRAFAQHLSRNISVRAILLFGSRARGDWLQSSDVDLLVLSDDLAGVPHLARLERLAAEWAHVSGLPADVLGLTPHEFARRAQELSVVGEIAREGVVVYSAPGWVRPAARPRRDSGVAPGARL